jgi:hypothetical protein
VQATREPPRDATLAERHKELLRVVTQARAQRLITRAQSGELGEMHRRIIEKSRRGLERSRALLARTRPHRPFE